MAGDPQKGGWQTEVERRDDVVYRASGPWSPAVVALLRHLEAAGFAAAPRVVGTGFAADGRETVTFVAGDSPHPYAWTDAGVEGVGVLLRELHEAAATFVPPADARWKPWFGRALAGSRPVIGHCDLGPWNIMAVAGLPVGFIDWEFAGPVDGVWELAQVAWHNAHLYDDDIAEKLSLPSREARAEQVRLLVTSYGLELDQRAGFVDKMIEFAVHSARQEAADYDVGPDATTAVGDDGYPVLWGITWRVRSASWMLRNRDLLDRALLG